MTHQIVLDTNVLVSALRSRRGASFKLLSLLTAEPNTGRFEINLSNALLFEYEDVLMRQHKELGLSAEDITAVLDFLCRIANLHQIYFLWRPALRDPSDDMVLELAVSASCPYIVSYNKRDFAGVEAFGIEVLDAREFLTLLGVLS